ncbi:adenosylcobinamide-GDP ribazoletransferase [Shewanella amazonensis]|uniref:Adenosylcobinamide-GDP ribazoletransferase n=1 Tax=Shewanella amazonensis (strain ATCC BAA-1098 / SB2B) TaxID=326297 RepID=COBS_SHEAM|nr:adenosylcobinamide-GDP ribazoletransferase [Shewanella amazonensis]A1S3L4.1 RecName: Full=Adenosylcobinamide-GDP ribazoletransferase; AltName: Full=Cobalamin synthase; AltName: Full=Cobalamin-5'-phosphate synthase [Shewanella amazonensis SB2B]ABL98970.1 cobalamin-5'-phosphate synthase [Shewanella amazonensis SB2B]
MSTFKRELELFLLALTFFTRIPVPVKLDYSGEGLNRASRYFGLVGTLVGLIAALVFYLTQFIFPASVAVVLAMIATVLLTGGFHEDGLADTADGFGGAFERERKLEIMKDSRVGSYGSLALMLALLLKFQLLSELALYSVSSVAGGLVLGHTLSRAFAASIIFNHTYVREDAESKAKPLAQSMHWDEVLFLVLSAGVICLLLTGVGATLVILVTLFVARSLLARWQSRHIGGYTGDTLGACQQILELVVYLVLLLLWSQS